MSSVDLFGNEQDLSCLLDEGLIIKKSDDGGYTWNTLDDEEYIDITAIVKGE